MRVGAIGLFAAALMMMTAAPRESGAQQFPSPPGPVSLSVPHPIPPPAATLAVPPRDLYLVRPPPPVVTPPIAVPPIGVPPGIVGHPIVRYPYVYGVPFYWGSSYLSSTDSTPMPAPDQGPEMGGLRFESSPGFAQVYVDGLYVGQVNDFGRAGRALDVEEGIHRVELRAAGYATLSFDVRIAPHQTMRYRGDLESLSQPGPAQPAPAAIPAPAAKASTTYVIPQCYAGDRPPSRPLPPGCDIGRMRVSR
jgi:PEGA domain